MIPCLYPVGVSPASDIPNAGHTHENLNPFQSHSLLNNESFSDRGQCSHPYYTNVWSVKCLDSQSCSTTTAEDSDVFECESVEEEDEKEEKEEEEEEQEEWAVEEHELN